MKKLFIVIISLVSLSYVYAATTNKHTKEEVQAFRLKQHQENVDFRNAQQEKRKAFNDQMDKERVEYIKSGTKDPKFNQTQKEKRKAFQLEMRKLQDEHHEAQKKKREEFQAK